MKRFVILFFFMICQMANASGDLVGKWITDLNYGPDFPFNEYIKEILHVSEASVNQTVMIGQQSQTRKMKYRKIDENTIELTNEEGAVFQATYTASQSELGVCIEQYGCKKYRRIESLPDIRRGEHGIPLGLSVKTTWIYNSESKSETFGEETTSLLFTKEYGYMAPSMVFFPMLHDTKKYVYRALVLTYLISSDEKSPESYGSVVRLLAGISGDPDGFQIIAESKDVQFLQLGKTLKIEGDYDGNKVEFSLELQ